MSDYIKREAAKSGFVLSGQDIFGRYAKIAYGYKKYGRIPGEQDYHIYKCIQRFRSNYWCDVPLTYQTENNCYNHGEMQDVVNVIHCGIDESKVIRVALKDIELLPPADVRKKVHAHCEITDGCAYCSHCKNNFRKAIMTGAKVCPRYGAIMKEGDDE